MKYSYSEPWDMAFDLTTTETLLCAPPPQPHDPDPADDAEGVSIDANLTWNNAVEALGNIQFIQAEPERNLFTLQCPVTYDVYFGTIDPPTSLLCENTTETLCVPGILENNTEYFWQVMAKNEAGETSGSVWSFTTIATPTPTPTPTPTCVPPFAPKNPDPGNGATHVPWAQILSWEKGTSATNLYAIDSDLDQLFVLDQSNGAATLIGSTASGPSVPAGLAG